MKELPQTGMRLDIKDLIQVQIPQQQDEIPQKIKMAVDECSIMKETYDMGKAWFGDDKNLLAQLSNKVDFFTRFHAIVEIN